MDHAEDYVVKGTTYRLGLVRHSELAPLVPFFRQVYRRGDFTLDWLRQKYGGEFGGLEGFSCVALTEAGRAAGSVGILPWPIRFGGRTELAAQVVDAATDAGHRRRGLFTRLGEMARALCERAGVTFLFAFPHPGGDSYPGFVRNLGYAHVDDLVEYRQPIRTIWMERLARRLGPLQHLYRRHVERTLRAHRPTDPVLENSLLAEGFAGTGRDRAFHDYKSFAGSRVLTVDGGRVWLKLRHGIQVADVEASSEAEMAATARALERLAVRLGAHRVILQSSKGTRFARFFAERFRPFPCVAVVYRNLHSEIPVERLRFTLGDLDNF
jgi:GNAT superfamily N-acetyltransferase